MSVGLIFVNVFGKLMIMIVLGLFDMIFVVLELYVVVLGL